MLHFHNTVYYIQKSATYAAKKLPASGAFRPQTALHPLGARPPDRHHLPALYLLFPPNLVRLHKTLPVFGCNAQSWIITDKNGIAVHTGQRNEMKGKCNDFKCVRKQT